MNFLILGYANSEDGVSFEPSVPLTNRNMKTEMAALVYARVFELGGQSAKIDVIVQYATLNGTAEYKGSPVERDVSGFGDPRVRFSMNFFGAPALSVVEFANYRQDLIVGGSIQVSVPVGQYDHDRLVNIGTNRWFVKPELGVSKAWGPWALELSVAATLFGDNDNFFGGKRREQDPICTLRVHLVYGFTSGIWAAISAANLSGGRTTLDGVRGNDLQKNSRVGLTLSLPVNRRNSIKLYANNGLYAGIGTDFDTIGIAWQYRWGEGF